MSFDSQKPFSTDLREYADEGLVVRAERIMELDGLSALRLIGVINHAIGFRQWDTIVARAFPEKKTPKSISPGSQRCLTSPITTTHAEGGKVKEKL
jgi:hypothetical protein